MHDTPPVITKPPFPWFGGKSRMAHLIWPRFGVCKNYVEPFFGSGAMLFRRPPETYPSTQYIETINDLDCYVANFWRAVKDEPARVVEHCDWPVNEADLHARHQWLVNSDRVKEWRALMHDDPDHYDVKIAGWWVWGLCQWIGTGWCIPGSFRKDGRCWQGTPNLHDAGKGVHRQKQQVPYMHSAGQGVHRQWQIPPHLTSGGQGVHRQRQKIPHLNNNGRGVHRGVRSDLYEYFTQIQQRLRYVRVCCGDWTRLCKKSVCWHHNGITGLFLDPPFASNRLSGATFHNDDQTISAKVRAWCIEHTSISNMRIALCGHSGEHSELVQHGWDEVLTKGVSGYSHGYESEAGKLAKSETVWFSPTCIGGVTTTDAYSSLEND